MRDARTGAKWRIDRAAPKWRVTSYDALSNMTDSELEARAEELGRMAQECGDPRDSNSYVELRRQRGSDELLGSLITAWYEDGTTPAPL